MDIVISHTDTAPIYEQIVRQIRAQIVSGSLPPSEPLPSIRQLANDLCVSAITTKRAYTDLETAGLITTVPGRGSFVAEKSHEALKADALRKIRSLLEEARSLADQAGIETPTLHDLLDGKEA